MPSTHSALQVSGQVIPPGMLVTLAAASLVPAMETVTLWDGRKMAWVCR